MSTLTSSNEKNSKLESCRSRRGLQFSYKNHLHPMSYRRVMIFRRFSRNKLLQVIKKDLYIEVIYVRHEKLRWEFMFSEDVWKIIFLNYIYKLNIPKLCKIKIFLKRKENSVRNHALGKLLALACPYQVHKWIWWFKYTFALDHTNSCS